MLDLGPLIRDVPDFPKKGILFKDITTLLKNPRAFKQSIDQLTDLVRAHDPRIVIGMEDRVLIVDDLLATGGTVSATIELVERLEGKVVAVAFLVELTALKGRDRLQDYEVISLLKF